MAWALFLCRRKRPDAEGSRGGLSPPVRGRHAHEEDRGWHSLNYSGRMCGGGCGQQSADDYREKAEKCKDYS